MRPNETILLRIESLDDNGLGVGQSGEHEMLVAGAAPGDKLEVSVAHVSRHRKTAWATIDKVVSPGPDRAPHFCPESTQQGGGCGGCALGHMSGAAQDKFKETLIRQSLTANDLDCPVSFTPAEGRTGYRNRSNYVPYHDGRGIPKLGSYRPGTRKPAPMDGCPIARAPIAAVATAIEKAIPVGVPLQPRPTGLRWVTLRASQSGEVLVDLVVGEPDASWLPGLVTLLSDIPNVAGVSFTVNTSDGNAIRNGPSSVASGQATVIEEIGGIPFPLHASSFSQLNSRTATTMYANAVTALPQGAVLWDLYCGAGGLGLTAARRFGASLYGTDSVGETVGVAREVATSLQVEACFEVLDLSKEIPSGWPQPTLVLVNPPRRGLDTPVLERLGALHCPVVYMSCHPTSFARDAAQLCANGYTLERVEGYDMLPHTPHVEMLGFFSRG